MIDKLEVGKTYRLIHKVGYFNNRYFNQQHYDHLFEKGCVTLDKVCLQGGGMCKMRNVISPYEYKFFELVKPEYNTLTRCQELAAEYNDSRFTVEYKQQVLDELISLLTNGETK